MAKQDSSDGGFSPAALLSGWGKPALDKTIHLVVVKKFYLYWGCTPKICIEIYCWQPKSMMISKAKNWLFKEKSIISIAWCIIVWKKVVILKTYPPVCDQWTLSENLMVLDEGLDHPTSWLAWSTMPPVQKNLWASWAISLLNSFCFSGVSKETGSMPTNKTSSYNSSL